MNGKNTILPRSCSSSSSSSLYGSGNGIGNSGSMTPIHGQNDPMYNGLVEYGSNIPIGGDELIGPETIDTSASGDSISVTVRFRPLSEREFQRGDEIAWYPDGDKIVRNEHNPAIAYAFGIASEFMM